MYSYCIALRGVALLLSGCIQYSTSVAGGKTRNENVYSIPNNGLAWIRCACVCASQQTVQRSTESPSRCVKLGDKLQSASNVELGCSVIDLLCREDGNDATARSALRRSQDQILGWPVCPLRLLFVLCWAGCCDVVAKVLGNAARVTALSELTSGASPSHVRGERCKGDGRL